MQKAKSIIGLSSKQALSALKKHGYNELEKEKKLKGLVVFARQFKNPIAWILIVAAFISYGIGERLNFWVILFIIGFVILMGFIQEYKAEKAVEALRQIVKPKTTVIRDGKLITIEAKEVVPGDLLSLEMGDRVPADSEVTHALHLDLDEAMLTGESKPAKKTMGETIYAGTQIVNGRCEALVTATGMQTKLGDIATMIQNAEEHTPLQKRMDELGRFLAIVALAAATIILLMGLARGASTGEILIVALALAVAAVPEGLPLTMTLALSFGMNKMAKKNALVRRMMAVETLGSTTMICSDKTGTLTKNEMTVQKVWTPDKTYDVTGVGYRPKGSFKVDGTEVKNLDPLIPLFKGSMLCNNANLVENNRHHWDPVGDPTEVAMLTMGSKAGYLKAELDEKYERVEEIFFTSKRKMMTTIHKRKGGFDIYSKGAPEVILDRCDTMLVNGKHKKLTKKDKEEILKQNLEFGHNALRVLAVAMKETKTKKIPSKDVEKGLTFIGLVAMRDPARPEVKGALQVCKKAGIKVMMITGDNDHTALAIGKNLGLTDEKHSKVVTGKQIDEMDDKALGEAIKEVRIFARTQPEHKLRIVTLLKKQGHVVAMTGDGINDAPALKKADIGIAMGIKGTDVTKEAADMILEDDNFVTIVEAVREGRRIYENIEKFTTYLISRNFTEVILIFFGIIFFDFHFLPLLAIQILFINAFDEEMPAIGLGLDQAHGELMNRKPRPPKEALMNKVNSFIVFSVALVMALISFAVFLVSDPLNQIEYARTMVFATIVAMVLVDTFNFRSLRLSVFQTGFFNNKFLILAVLVIFGVTGLVMYNPSLAVLFELTPLSGKDWGLALAAALLVLVYMEVLKGFRRAFEK